LVYLVECSDQRNIFVFEILKERQNCAEFKFSDGSAYEMSVTVVFSPARKLLPDEARALPADAAVVGGAQSDGVLGILDARGIQYRNLLSDEEYAVRNAKLTAEAALSLIIGGTDKSVFENNVLVLGCGRVGKAVALLLAKTGIKTAVATFDQAELAAAALYADTAFPGQDLSAHIGGFDVVINTIPAKILDGAILEKIAPGTMLFELASVDCLDRGEARGYPFEYVPAPGLPAKYSARAAAAIMAKSILARAVG